MKKPSGNVGTRTCVAGISSQQKCYIPSTIIHPPKKDASRLSQELNNTVFSHSSNVNSGNGKRQCCLRGVHTVVHEAILPRTFVRVRPSQPRTCTKVRVRVRVRRPPTMLDFCTSYTCTTYKCTSLLYSDELQIKCFFTRYTL